MLSDERIAEIAETHIGRLKDIGHKSGLVIRTDAELACESAIRNALAEAAQSPAVPVMGEAVAFGSGDKIVGVGTYKNVPAVFVMPAPIVGVVGERAGDIYSKDSIIACEFVLTFPTGNQAQAVADALCNATSITQAELDALRKDAERYQMVVKISTAALCHPSTRTDQCNSALSAYQSAVNSGIGIVGAIDAAIAAEGEPRHE